MIKVLSIRTWLTVVLGLITTLLVFIIGGTILMLEEGHPDLPDNTAFQTLIANSANWSQSLWQQELETNLAQRKMFAVIRDGRGQQLYRSPALPSSNLKPWQVIVINDNTRLQGSVSLYDRSIGFSLTELYLLGGLAILLVSLVITAWITSRAVLKPLQAVIGATRQVAAGNLDFTLPASKVKEVAQVVEAFKGMGHALQSSLLYQAKLEQERNFFIVAVAHDLRTPLFSLRGYLQGLAQGLAATPQKAARYVQICQEQANTLEHLVEDLFTFARLEYTESSVRCEALDLDKLIRQTVESRLPQAQAQQISLVVQTPVEPCPVKGDWHLLSRALGNLLDNALCYSEPGGKVEITWRREAEQVVFTVSDSGPGIAVQDLPHLFEPLYRGENSVNRQTGGAGMGLSISQRILRSHGGGLKASNRPAEVGGATFSGSLAYQPTHSL